MPGTATITGVNQPLTPLALSTSQDTYTLTLARDFSAASPLILRLVVDAGGLLFTSVTGGTVFHFNQPNWPFYLQLTGKTGDLITLTVKATTGTPNLYLMTLPASAD